MINSINSYSNYNYYTNTLNSNKKNSKTNDSVDNNNNKEINNNINLNNNNNNNNISNNTSLKQINSNLVSDKSKAINKILGYGVDEDGFFTSDFNEAAGIPKDYKIYAKGIESFVNSFLKKQPFYSQIDIAKTIGNAYNSFSFLVNDRELGQNFKEQDLKNLSNNDGINYWKKFQDNTATFWELADIKLADLGSDKYQIKDGEISKGGALIAFFANHPIVEGTTTLLGKMAGLDKNISNSEIKDFISFMNSNHLTYSVRMKSSNQQNDWDNPIGDSLSIWDYMNRAKNLGDDKLIKTIEKLGKEYNELINSNMSLNEFKTKYLDFKERHDKFVEQLTKEEKAKGIDYSIDIASGQSISNNKNKKIQDDNTQKSFKPIQAESKNKETYKDDNIRNELIKKLLENKFDLAKELEILFNVKIDNDNTNNNSNSNDNSNDNNSNSNHLSKLSSKTKTKHRSVNIKV
ncbi:Cj0814 family flagellar-dependent secreted protein [Campylobacter sp. MRC_CM3]|uniref:Cj0814 family flagellar-dependent secreted protein n=1 Tax=Campylobacter molothri TaxID=1032242 RepID=UPI0035B3CC98